MGRDTRLNKRTVADTHTHGHPLIPRVCRDVAHMHIYMHTIAQIHTYLPFHCVHLCILACASGHRGAMQPRACMCVHAHRRGGVHVPLPLSISTRSPTHTRAHGVWALDLAPNERRTHTHWFTYTHTYTHTHTNNEPAEYARKHRNKQTHKHITHTNAQTFVHTSTCSRHLVVGLQK